MVHEVDDAPLPAGWEVLMSRSQNMPYYSNIRTKKVYWVDDELPRGWSHQFDDKRRRYYFHIGDKNATITYDKPVLRTAKAANAAPTHSPEPLPVPEPTYDRAHDDHNDDAYSNDGRSSQSRRFSDDDNSSAHGTPRSSSSDHNASARSPWRAAAESLPPVRTAERKKSKNSLLDLLSPGPPALVHTDERSPDGGTSPGPAVTSSSSAAASMNIANLVTPSHAVGSKRSHEQISDPAAAAAFYNKLQRNATSDRADSMLFHMRAMNNWVKSILINDFAKRGDRVLDLACGKGGDLMKWVKRSVASYVGVDIAQKSLEDAVERCRNNPQSRELDVAFIQGDLGAVSLTDSDAHLHCWSRDDPQWHMRATGIAPATFDVVSMQFAFHYMFGDEARAHRFFRTLHSLLRDGGVFIATTVDPNKVLMKYYQGLTPPGPTDDLDDRGPTHNKSDVRIVDEKGREVCTIKFDAAVRAQLLGRDAAPSGRFGLRYKFTLRDSDALDDGDDTNGGGGNNGTEAVDTPEYLVPDDLLARLIKEHGFELMTKQNFHQFILKNTDKHRSLLEKMKVMNYDGSVSDVEWDIAGLYQVLAFKKMY